MPKHALLITIKSFISLALVNRRAITGKDSISLRASGEYAAYIHAAKVLVNHAKITGMW